MNITIAVCGFQHEIWQKQFFPDDLPEDWRFDYYANEFDSILFSESDQQILGKELLEEMVNEADADFLFALEGEVPPFDLPGIKCCILSVIFPTEKNIERVSGFNIERAEIINQQNLDKTVCVLRINSIQQIKNEDIKQILMHVYTKYAEFDPVCLFLGQGLQDIDIINTARIINDLL